MKRGFLTEYSIDCRKYSSYIIAKDLATAKFLVQKRGLNERIVSNLTTIHSLILSPLEVKRAKNITPQILHAVCFLSFIAAKSNVIDPISVLADNGCLHELIHSLSNTGDKKISELKRMINSLILNVPGVY